MEEKVTVNLAQGKVIRVKAALEELVERMAESESLMEFPLRNLAYAFGILFLAVAGPEILPRDDEEYERLLSLIIKLVEAAIEERW